MADYSSSLVFMQTASKSEIDSWLAELDQIYYYPEPNQEPISDEIYDALIDIYQQRFGPRLQTGATPTHSKVPLPIPMTSLNKVMDTEPKKLFEFTRQNPGPYVISDKVDGVSVLLINLVEGEKVHHLLYGKGKGLIGSDWSHILPYLTPPQIDATVYIRGELYYPRADFQKDSGGRANPRNMVAGLANAKYSQPQYLKNVHFVAYRLIFPEHPEYDLPLSQQLEALKNYGFEIPSYRISSTLTVEKLKDRLVKRKSKAPYDIDGLVITQDSIIPRELMLEPNNPKYAIAFKALVESDTAITEVVSVEWSASSLRRLVPVVIIQPVHLSGAELTRFAGYNASFIRDSGIGPGAVIKVIRSGEVIPKILEVIESVEPSLPPDDGTWYWSGEDIVLKSDTDEVVIKRNEEFFKQIGAKYLGPKTIEALYYAGFATIPDLISMTREDLTAAGFPGKSGDRIWESIDSALKGATLVQMMAGSDEFGFGFGVRRLQKILEVYPDIMEREVSVDEIRQIEGFDTLTATRFVEGLPKFKEFWASVPRLHSLIPLTPPSRPKKESALTGKTVVFSNVRDKGLEAKIMELGGKIGSRVSRNTDYLISEGERITTKITDAQKYGIPIMDREQFKEKFGL